VITRLARFGRAPAVQAIIRQECRGVAAEAIAVTVAKQEGPGAHAHHAPAQRATIPLAIAQRVASVQMRQEETS